MTTTSRFEDVPAARTIAPGPLLVRSRWRWWTVELRGLVAVVFGIFAIFAPARAVVSLVVLFGIYALVDGALALGLGIQERATRRVETIVRGLVSIAAGVVALAWPGISALVLLVIIALWAIVAGLFDVTLAIRLRKQLSHEWLLGVEGALSLAFGILLLIAPLVGAIVLGLWVGAFALVTGGMLVETGLRLRWRTHAFT